MEVVGWSRNPEPVVELTASATVTRPSGTAAGDLLVVSLYTEGADAVAPAGWTLVQRVSPGWFEHDVWAHIDDGSAGPWAFSWSGVEANAWACIAVRGVNLASPINASSFASATGSSTVTAPAVTTTVPGTLLMLLGTTDGAATGDPPADMTELLDRLPTYVADGPLPAAGNTGPQTITWSTAPNSTAVLLALAPLSSPPEGALQGGFLRAASGALVTTTDATGAALQGGFLRAASGALVTTTDATGAALQGGFLRAASGALVTTTDAAGADWKGGFLRTPSWALVVA